MSGSRKSERQPEREWTMDRWAGPVALAILCGLGLACGDSVQPGEDGPDGGGSVAPTGAPHSTLVCELEERDSVPQPPTTRVADFGAPVRLALNDPCPQDAVEVSPDGNRIYHYYSVNDFEVLEAEGRLFEGIEVRFQDRLASGGWSAPRVLDLKGALPDSLPGETRIAPDGSWVVWQALAPQNLGYVEGLPAGQTFDLDLYEADVANDVPGPAWHLPAGVNSPYLEGEHWVSRDGLTLYVASNRPGGQGGLDVWRARRDPSGAWSAPEPLPAPVNLTSDDLQPTLSPDGRWLYVVSDRNGAKGIWRVPTAGDTFGPEAELVLAPYAGEPSFSDDGRLFFAHAEIDFSVNPPHLYDVDIYSVAPTR